VTLVSRDASLGSFGLDMMEVTRVCGMMCADFNSIAALLTTSGMGANTDRHDVSLRNPASRTAAPFGGFGVGRG
jgi:hypothetical protein